MREEDFLQTEVAFVQGEIATSETSDVACFFLFFYFLKCSHLQHKCSLNLILTDAKWKFKCNYRVGWWNHCNFLTLIRAKCHLTPTFLVLLHLFFNLYQSGMKTYIVQDNTVKLDNSTEIGTVCFHSGLSLSSALLPTHQSLMSWADRCLTQNLLLKSMESTIFPTRIWTT